VYELCASPQQYTDLSKGSHVLRVRAIDGRGFADLSPAAYTWTVNPSALNATITSKPANPSTASSATFAFTGNGGAYECSLDEGAYALCTSPTTYMGMAEGVHSFRVRAVGAGGQRGTAESYTWTIANAAPQANDQSVTAGKNQATSITLTAVDDEPLIFSVLTPPAHGVLSGAAPDLFYTPDSDYVGADSFTFSASNGAGATDTGMVTITMEDLEVGEKLYLPSIWGRDSTEVQELNGTPGRDAGTGDAGTGDAGPSEQEPGAPQAEDAPQEQEVQVTVKMYLPALGR
jgi:hypothetical protein